MEQNFNHKTSELLNNLEQRYKTKDLNKIKFRNLVVLIKAISEYKPKSKIKNEEELILQYLNLIAEKDLTRINNTELVLLKRNYIDPCIRKFLNKGFRYQFAWLFMLLFILLFDLLLYLVIGFFVPVFSFVFCFVQIKKEIKAYKENKLW